MIFIDTGYLLAIVDPRDQLHTRARAWAQAVREPLPLTEQIIWECGNHLSAPADRPKFHELVRRLRTQPHREILPASADLLEFALRFHAQHADQEWSLTDCLSFVVMRDRGITRALSHDHHYEQAGFEALLRRDPP